MIFKSVDLPDPLRPMMPKEAQVNVFENDFVVVGKDLSHPVHGEDNLFVGHNDSIYLAKIVKKPLTTYSMAATKSEGLITVMGQRGEFCSSRALSLVMK